MTRIVHCPGCKVLLVEPTAGIAIYQCGNCFKVLYAKHAIQASLNVQQEQLIHDQQQQQRQQQQLPSKNASTPAPLYTQRGEGAAPASVTSTLSPSPAEHANGKRLYTPRPQQSANGAQAPSSLLLQDMRKLAIDAFPSKQTDQESLSEFEFHKQLSSYKQQADDGGSDYHSTLEELDSSSRRSAVSDYYSSSARVDYEEKAVLSEKYEEPVAVRNHHHHHHHHHDGNGSAFSRSTSSDSDLSPLSRDQQPPNSTSSSLKEEQSGSSSSHKRYPPLESPYVWCQHCKMLLEVPCNLPPCNSSVQKLRCGACQRVSRFTVVNQHPNSSLSSSDNFNFTSSSGTPRDATKGPRDPMLQLDIMTSTSPGLRGSAPASFHHVPQQVSRFFASGDSKGYDSAPEFQTSYSAASYDEQRSSNIHHARSESGTSGRSLPMAPCLHELFGYESPSQFLHKQQPPDDKIKDRSGGRGIKGLILRSIHDMSKLHVSAESPTNVTVNGNTISQEVVRRAEKQAGNIYPGSYWYDYRAGFWGVMGGPCLGIIPPCIEEFNHPMQLSCAGGKTGVVVNGRELHQQDMEVLVKRGLPPTSNVAYTIDIDGTVVDLSNQKQVICLGRLAPSIEKRGVGFGMYPLTS